MKEAFDHYTANQPVFEMWVESKQVLPHSHDLIQPLIPFFVEQNPGVNLASCHECIHDMLRWYKKELKPVKTFNERLDEVADKKIKKK